MSTSAISVMPRPRGGRRRAFAAAGVAAAMAIVTACGSSGPGESGGGANAWGLTGADEDTLTASFESWSSENPDNAIQVEFFENDAYKEKIGSSIGSGQAPTLIFGWGGGGLRTYVRGNRVMDLSNAVKQNPELADRYLDSVLQNGQVDGKTYALPLNGMQPVVLFFNKELFQQANVQPPKTWEDLMSLVQTFKQRQITPIALAGASKWPGLMWLEYLVDRIGGPEVFRKIADNEADAWSDPAVQQATKMIQQLVDAGAFGDKFNSVSYDNAADSALLHTGKAAMYLMGSWGWPTIKDNNPKFIADGKLGYTTFPTVSGGQGDPTNIVGNPANYWSISADAPKPAQDAALAYLKDGLMTDKYVDDLLATGAVPPLKGIEDKLAGTEDPEYTQYVYDLAGAAPNFELSWDQALTPKQADAMLNNLQRVFLKQITPEQFSANMNKTIAKK